MTTISNTQDQDKARLLRSVLLGNSIFSFLFGLDFTLFSRPVAKFLGLSSPTVILILGIGLMAYALALFTQSRAKSLSLPFAWFAIVADEIWVIGSAVLIFTNLVAFTTPGKWAIAIIADIVLAFAIAQYVGLRRMKN